MLTLLTLLRRLVLELTSCIATFLSNMSTSPNMFSEDLRANKDMCENLKRSWVNALRIYESGIKFYFSCNFYHIMLLLNLCLRFQLACALLLILLSLLYMFVQVKCCVSCDASRFDSVAEDLGKLDYTKLLLNLFFTYI